MPHREPTRAGDEALYVVSVGLSGHLTVRVCAGRSMSSNVW